MCIRPRPRLFGYQSGRDSRDGGGFARSGNGLGCGVAGNRGWSLLQLWSFADPPPKSTYETLLEDISQLVEDHASALLIDPSSQVKRVMLSTVAELCLFFGRRKSNDFILSHIMTYLNDRDWSLRFAFFDAIVGVGAFLGHVSVEEYVLPLMMQALAGELRLSGCFQC